MLGSTSPWPKAARDSGAHGVCFVAVSACMQADPEGLAGLLAAAPARSAAQSRPLPLFQGGVGWPGVIVDGPAVTWILGKSPAASRVSPFAALSGFLPYSPAVVIGEGRSPSPGFSLYGWVCSRAVSMVADSDFRM